MAGSAKVEVIREDGKFRVQAVFRDPFEYFFEIAVHNARFESRFDANRLAERVRAETTADALKWASPANRLTRDHWDYRSSAYTARMGSEGQSYDVLTSERAKNFLNAV